jgi:translation initiation factor IF-3
MTIMDFVGSVAMGIVLGLLVCKIMDYGKDK